MSLKTEIEAIAQHIANEYMKSGQQESLSKLVAINAEERNFNPEQIKRLIEETNRAVFYEIFNKKQDKNVEFPIARFEEVIAYLNPSSANITPERLDENWESLVDESDFDLSDLELLESKKQMFNDLPRNKLEEIKNEVNEAKEREKDKAIRITITYLKQAANEVKIAAMQESEFRQKLREILKEAAKLGLNINDVNMALKQMLGQNYTPDIQKIIEQEYKQVLSQNAPVKVAAKKDVGLTKHELEFLESLRELNPENMKKIVSLADKVDPERLKRVVSNTYGPTSIKAKLVDKLFDNAKGVAKDTANEMLKQIVNTASQQHPTPELSTEPIHKSASWKLIDAKNLFEQNKDVVLGLRESLIKKAEAISMYIQTRETLIDLADNEVRRRAVLNAIDKKAEDVVNQATNPGKKNWFSKVTDVANAAAPLINVATGTVGLIGGIQQLRSLNMDIEQKKRQLGYGYKFASAINDAIARDLTKSGAMAAVPAAAQVAAKSAPVLKKIWQGLKATSNFLNENSYFVNLGLGAIQNQINQAIEDKQEQLNRLNKLGAFPQPDWNLLLNSTNLIRSNASHFANRPYNLRQLKEAIKAKNPDWEDELISRTLNTLANFAPTILEDPYLTEEIVRRVRTYGGFDPSYIEQLEKVTERAQNLRANKPTSIEF